MEKMILASGNKDKLKEIREILKDLPLEIVSMGEEGIDLDIVEDGSTFEENASIKANAVMKITGTPVIADDSGLEIDFFDGAPGIYSARFMGKDTPYPEKIRRILEEMKDVPWEGRGARFVCSVACAFPDERGTITVKETCEGYIATEPAGENGFGYDPVFFYPPAGCTTSCLSTDEKNAISHRGKAVRAMYKILKEQYGIVE